MWPRAGSRGEARQAAVIDIGSNSVRLVIYRLDGRAIWTVYNEKALAGLGRDLPETGQLSAEGVEAALTVLRRFRALLDGWRTEDVMAVATAAVREAANGRDFLQRVRRETGLVVRLLAGEEEARYAALGVLAGHPRATGVVGDLGGFSLELIRLDGAAPADGVSLPLGPFALGAPSALNLERTRNAVETALATHTGRFAAAEFHAVGGAWRNLALLHMELADYPLRIAHHYEMARDEAVEVVRFVTRQSKASLQRVQGLSKRRFETLPHAALVLESVIEALGVERVVVSAFGLREGLLLEAMEPAVGMRDPLIEGCEMLTAERGLSSILGRALEAWISPLFNQLPPVFGERDGVLMAAACRLAELGARLHPDHRADVAFEQVLRAPVPGMNHAERAFLATCVFARHTTAPTTPEEGVVARVLSSERRHRARALGAGIRLGCDLSGRNPRLLEHSSLTLCDGHLKMTACSGWEDMLLGEQTARRAQALASALNLSWPTNVAAKGTAKRRSAAATGARNDRRLVRKRRD